MTVRPMEIRDVFGENLPGFDLQRTRDALAAYVAARWPVGRRKFVMKEWGLSEDEARSVTTGRASWSTFDKIIFHPRGGWRVLFPIFGALLNQSADAFLHDESRRHAEHAQRLGALVGDFRPRAPTRLPNSPSLAGEQDRRLRPVSHRARKGEAARPVGGGSRS